VIAGLVAAGATYLVYRLFVRRRGSRGFRVGQIVSASLVSLAHGTNDAQKTMGVITLTLSPRAVSRRARRRRCG
jgi:PiT family inorganic phosphate transporter